MVQKIEGIYLTSIFRNLLGLGTDDQWNSIIGECYYLKEIVGDKIRMPYNIRSTALLVGIDKLLDFGELTFGDIFLQEGSPAHIKDFFDNLLFNSCTSLEEMKDPLRKQLKDDDSLRDTLRSWLKEEKLGDGENDSKREVVNFVKELFEAVNVYHKPIPLSQEEMIAISNDVSTNKINEVKSFSL